MAKGLLFIDYDNTMVVHNPNIYAYSSSDRDDFLKMMNSAEDIFKDDKPCKAMQWFVAKWKCVIFATPCKKLKMVSLESVKCAMMKLVWSVSKSSLTQSIALIAVSFMKNLKKRSDR